MSRHRTTVVTLEVRLDIPRGKTAADIVQWLAAMIIRDITLDPGDPDHRTASEITKGQKVVKLVKKEIVYN